MRKILMSVAFVLAAMLALTTGSSANNPLLSGSSQGTVVSDNELSQVKGSGYYANLYGYYGSYYASYANIYGALGNYYNYLGYTGPGNYATTYYYYAYYYAYYAQYYYYYAYYYSYYNS